MRSLSLGSIAVLLSFAAACGADDSSIETPASDGSTALDAPVASWHDAHLLPLPTPEGDRQVGVRLTEYSIEMTRERLPAGEIEFQIVNAGTTLHYLLVRNDSVYAPSRHLQPGDTTIMMVDLAPGEYQYLCTIRDEFDHYSEGMSGNIIVY
jgi:plastocyanin